MKYENLKSYSDEQFRRITGVKRATFEKNVGDSETKAEGKTV